MTRRQDRVPKLIDGGTRAPGCLVRGCAEQIRKGALICQRHAEVLRPVPGRVDVGLRDDAAEDRP